MLSSPISYCFNCSYQLNTYEVGQTTVEFILHRAFFEGEFTIPVENKSSKIKIEKIQNNESILKVFMGDFVFHGKQDQLADYHGITNIYKVNMTFPSYEKTESFDSTSLKKECIKYLNPLLETIRYYTKDYWLDRLNEHDIQYFRILEEVDDSGKKTKGFLISFEGTFYPIQRYSIEDKKDEITNALENSIPISDSERLLLDSMNYFTKGLFNIAVIAANTALELFIEEYVNDILILKYDTKRAQQKAKIILGGKKLHSKVQRCFFGNNNHEELMKSNHMYKLFDYVRVKRANAVHYNAQIKQEEASKVIDYVRMFLMFLIDNYLALRSIL